MLKKFEVENFKGFEKKLVFDLSARDYAFNKKIVKNGVVNKAIVYGKNGVGKSCLGIAIFDICRHLTDKERMNSKYLKNYINLNSDLPYAIFKYYFQFDNDEVIYEYAKKDPDNLIYEKLLINDEIFLDYNFDDSINDSRKNYIDERLRQDLNSELIDNKLSVVKYIYSRLPTDLDSPLTKMMHFCEKMLWYRSLSDGNVYCGFKNGGEQLSEILYNSNKLDDFQKFLKANDVNYNLKFIQIDGKNELMVDYNGNLALFETVASTGTMAIYLYFIWKISSFDDISFLFIDEFDAFFHFESAETIVKQLNDISDFQTILTSHNTYLMQNDLTRPDCCFVMSNNSIKNLINCTEKEIREAHNLEKMYINGAFDE